MKATTSQLADILSISRRRLDELSAAGIIPKQSRNSYDLKEAIPAFIRFREEEIRAELPAAGDAEERFRAARASLYEERSAKARTERLLLEGSSFDAAAIVHVIGAQISATRAKLLSLPNSCAPAVAEVSDPEACRKILDEAVREVLTELSETVPAADIINRFRDQSGQQAAPSTDSNE